MNILITGSNGQLGSEIRQLAPSYPQHTFFFTDVAELDITNSEAVLNFVQSQNVDVCVNCAAYTAVDKAESDAERCKAINVIGPSNLASAMSKVGGKMIQISTDYVFDGTAHKPYTEDAPVSPIGVYGETKLEGENTVLHNCSDSAIVRTSWLYSAYGNNFVKTMLRLGREREELGVIFDQIGTPTYARDLALAVLTMVDKGIVPGIYHFSNEGVCSWYDFAREIHRLAGIQCRVRPLHTAEYPTPAQRPHYSVLDKTKIKQTYGIEIPWWTESLRDCLQLLS